MGFRLVIFSLLLLCASAQDGLFERPLESRPHPLSELAGSFRPYLQSPFPQELSSVSTPTAQTDSLSFVDALLELPVESPRRLVRSGLSLRCVFREPDGTRCSRSSFADGLCYRHQPDRAFQGRYFSDPARQGRVRFLGAFPATESRVVVVVRE